MNTTKYIHLCTFIIYIDIYTYMDESGQNLPDVQASIQTRHLY